MIIPREYRKAAVWIIIVALLCVCAAFVVASYGPGSPGYHAAGKEGGGGFIGTTSIAQ